MTDWRKKIDDDELFKQIQEKKDWQAQFEKINQEREVKVRELGERFKCQICGTSAKEPRMVGRGEYLDNEQDWDSPGDLKACLKCHNWICQEHIYKGICQQCAEKM